MPTTQAAIPGKGAEPAETPPTSAGAPTSSPETKRPEAAPEAKRPEAPAGALAVRTTQFFKKAVFAGEDLVGALAATDLEGFPVDMTGPSEQVQSAASCRQMKELQAQRFTGRRLDGHVRLKCATLARVVAARAASRTYLDKFVLNKNSPRELPPTLIGSLLVPESRAALEAAAAAGKSWAEQAPKLKVTLARPDILEVEDPDPEMELSFEVAHLAWGEFTGDDVEDVLLSVVMVEDAVPWWTLVAITRTEASGRLAAVVLE